MAAASAVFMHGVLGVGLGGLIFCASSAPELLVNDDKTWKADVARHASQCPV